MSATAPAGAPPRRVPRREPELTFLRLVPRPSPVHHLWAGTKLLVAAELATIVSISPTWPMLAVVSAVVVLGLLVARIPLGAFPRLPRWFFGLLLVGAALSMWSDTKPVADVAGVTLSLGGLAEWGRLTLLTVVLLVSGALIGWTTPLGDIAPALSTLMRPLRWLRLPVDEWIVAIALAIRCLPLLVDEIRALAAARRLRAHDVLSSAPAEGRRSPTRQLLLEAHDLLATAIVTSIRRAPTSPPRDRGRAGSR